MGDAGFKKSFPGIGLVDMRRILIAADPRIQIDVRFRDGFAKLGRLADLQFFNRFSDHLPYSSFHILSFTRV